jgi:hypothetical protein
MEGMQKTKRRIRALEDWVSRLTYKRKCRLYCVGTSKSGTHSINTMFNNSVRSQHEPESGKTIRKIIEIYSGNIYDKDIKHYLRKRDRRLCLDVDSSQLNFFFINELITEFTDARFLLTIRDVYSWLDSFINDSLRRQSPKDWIMLREMIFRSDVFTHPPEENALRSRGLYTLDGYLTHWANHNQNIISSVPRERLLIIRTNEITGKAIDIAKFAGLSKDAVNRSMTHSYKNPKKYGILHKIDRNYLEQKVGEHCRPLMEKFFPYIKSP